MQFVKGMDISLVRELEKRGAEYSLKGEKQDVFKILQTCGANMIRLRLWNDPYSEDGKAYGGGTNDLAATIELAKRTKANQLGFMLDFHYSDFWADPAKQIKPKKWKNLAGKELQAAVYEYTAGTLKKLKKEQLIPDMVQVGNEITKGLLWPDGHIDHPQEMASLIGEGCRAVREICPEAKIILHLDFGTDNKMYREWFGSMVPYQLDFDIIGMSYYPYWNGSLEELLFNMNDVSQRFDKDILVAETAIGYTTDTLGCTGLVFSREQEKAAGYPATQEGQTQFLQDLCKTVREVKGGRGIGICYWEPAWLPIPECTWANQIGCDYMKDKAETGNTMANQALFDARGNANQALIWLQTM